MYQALCAEQNQMVILFFRHGSPKSRSSFSPCQFLDPHPTRRLYGLKSFCCKVLPLVKIYVFLSLLHPDTAY